MSLSNATFALGRTFNRQNFGWANLIPTSPCMLAAKTHVILVWTGLFLAPLHTKSGENLCHPSVKRKAKAMKITKLTTYIVPPRWCFLKIETDEGVTGWGEPILEGRALAVEAMVHELSDYLVGTDPLLIEGHWNVLFRGGFYRGGGVHMSAIAGIDQALWDIKGKAAGLPIHALLGGKCRDKIKVYSWIGGDRPADVAETAKEMKAHGFQAIKLNGCEEMQIVDTNAKIDAAIATIATIREAVGRDIGIGVDFHGRVQKPMAKILVKELEPCRLMFIEEPVLSENREALREIAHHTTTPIALGERLY